MGSRIAITSMAGLGVGLTFFICGCALFNEPKPQPESKPPVALSAEQAAPRAGQWVSDANLFASANQCSSTHFFIKDSEGIEFYKADCADGSQMLIGCDNLDCREL